jgi:hypothetical protein
MTTPIGLDELIQAVQSQHPAGDPLVRLQDAMLISQQLSEQADHLIGHFVDQARRAGASWSAIGEAMGVTKQAAQKRFVVSLAGGTELSAPSFARFTPRARSALAAAQAEARRMGSAEVGPEHLLLGLVTEPEGIAAKVLTDLGATPGQLRQQAGAPEGKDAKPDAAQEGSERVRFGPPARKALELTLQEALSLGHNYIGTEHLLLGVAAEGGAGTELLAGLGITAGQARERVSQVISELVAAMSQDK